PVVPGEWGEGEGADLAGLPGDLQRGDHPGQVDTVGGDEVARVPTGEDGAPTGGEEGQGGDAVERAVGISCAQAGEFGVHSTTAVSALDSSVASSALSSMTSRPPPSAGIRMMSPRPSFVTSRGPSP